MIKYHLGVAVDIADGGVVLHNGQVEMFRGHVRAPIPPDAGELAKSTTRSRFQDPLIRL